MMPKRFLIPIVYASVMISPTSDAQAPEGARQELNLLTRFQQAKAKRAAVALLEDIRILDDAVNKWALEHNKDAGAMPTPQELAVYAEKGTRLHAELAAGRFNDSLGNPITVRGVDSVPLVSRKSVEQFASVAEPGFWEPYYDGPELSTAPLPEAAPANPTTKHELQLTALRLVEEMRMLDAAMDQWALENIKLDGAQARPQDLLPYIKKSTRLHGELAAGRLNDSLGNPIVIPPIGQIPTISKATAERLAATVSSDFWGQFAAK